MVYKVPRRIPFRTWIAVMLFLTTYINYLTRANMSISITAMVKSKKTFTPECKEAGEETSSNATSNATTQSPDIDGKRYDWDQAMQGQILGAYFYGYFVACLPSGLVAEWVGPFWVIFIATLISGILNSASVFAADISVYALIACRVLLGFLAAFVFPALHVLIARWAPPAEKGKFVSCMMGNTLGTCLCWALVGWVSAAVNWQWGFHVLTIQIAVYLVIFWFITSDSPEQSRWVSDEEKEFIKTAQEGRVSKTKAVPPYLAMFTSIPFWAIMIAQFGNLWGLYLQLTGVPKFLVEVVGFSLKDSGFLGALPQLVRLFLGFGFGFLGDYLLKREKMSKTMIRKFFILFSHILPGLVMMGLWLTRCSEAGAVALLTVSMGLNGAAVTTHLQNNQDLSPNFAATIYSMHSFIGGTTGFIAPAVTSALIKSHNGINEWGIVFLIGGSVYIIGGVIFIIMGSTDVQPWNEKKEDNKE